MTTRFRSMLALLIALGTGACGTSGRYMWVDDVPADKFSARGVDGDYRIVPGDLVFVRVFGQDALSSRARVLSDGTISLPLVGNVRARDRRPAELAKELEEKYKQYLVAPSVSVVLEETRPLQVSVLGEVTKPGIFTLGPSAGVLDAIASAGGPTEYASRDRIFVLRTGQGSALLRIRFTYDRLTQAQGKAATFALQSGDVVVVE